MSVAETGATLVFNSSLVPKLQMSLLPFENSLQTSGSVGHLRSRIITAGCKLKELSISRLKTFRPVLAGVGQLSTVPAAQPGGGGPCSAALQRVLQ